MKCLNKKQQQRQQMCCHSLWSICASGLVDYFFFVQFFSILLICLLGVHKFKKKSNSSFMKRNFWKKHAIFLTLLYTNYFAWYLLAWKTIGITPIIGWNKDSFKKTTKQIINTIFYGDSFRIVCVFLWLKI